MPRTHASRCWRCFSVATVKYPGQRCRSSINSGLKNRDALNEFAGTRFALLDEGSKWAISINPSSLCRDHRRIFELFACMTIGDLGLTL
jgi:hypothetical protein